MAADVAKFQAGLDKVFKTFSSQEVQLDPKELKGLGQRGTTQYIEQKFQAHLQRARAAFLQEFRNHAVVVESEVRKIREELTGKMEEQYGEKLAALREQLSDYESLVQSHRVEISQLKSLAAAQETYLTAARHRWGLENKEVLKDELDRLKKELVDGKGQIDDLTHQLTCRDELVSQLSSELASKDGELRTQAEAHAEDKKHVDERWAGLRKEMQQQQKEFVEHLQRYEAEYQKYKAKTTQELQLQEILNKRLTEALANMEEERQLHIKARTKPTPRIGEEQSPEDQRCVPYDLEQNARYRVDDMGMDTSWRDYQLSNMQFRGPKTAMPKFQVDRARRVVPLPGQQPETPRPPHAQMLQLPPMPAANPRLGSILAGITPRQHHSTQ